jgi:hypothetical protein
MRVAIHQPNFLPWLGLFQRISLVDTFVFFDHVQAMGGRSWLSRNRLLIGGKEAWLSIPVRKSGRLGQLVSEVEINYEPDFVQKFLRTIEYNYKKAPYFNDIFPMIAGLIDSRQTFIAAVNMEFIRWVCELLGLSVRFLRSSDLVTANSHLSGLAGNDLVLGICRAAGARQYVSGGGCLDFIRPEAFESVGIPFYFQRFDHPIYRQIQTKQFVSHLSVLDALFNVGPEETRHMVCQPTMDRAIENIGGIDE